MHITLTINSRDTNMLKLSDRSGLHNIQSMVYNLLPESHAAFLHNHGYVVDNRPLKLFAMSWPLASWWRACGDGNIEYTLPIRLIISTPITETLDGIASGALTKNMRIGANIVYCEKVETQNHVVGGEKITIRTLSPITCYTQMLRLDGRKYTTYFSPREKEFGESINTNLQRKYRALYPGRQVPNGTVNIKPLRTPQEQVATFKANSTFPLKGWSGIFEMSGPKELLQVGIDCGLGAKNSSGFGCVVLEGPG